MRILIAGSIQIDGGYEEEALVKSIAKYLKDHKHMVDTFMLPYVRDMLSLPDQIAAYQMLDISNIDLLITVGYPACVLQHHNKIIYLFETAPMLNEYWDSEYGVLASQQYSRLLHSVSYCEEKVFKEAKKIVCNSELLSNDITRKYMINTSTQYCPNIFDTVEGKFDLRKDYYVCETSLMPYHRMELLLDTLRKEPTENLVIYIPRANSIYHETLLMQIEDRNLSDRVFVFKSIAPNDVLKNAKAFITTDYQVRKISAGVIRSVSLNTNIIACEDSGAIAEFINLHKCGIVKKADPVSLSSGISAINSFKKQVTTSEINDVNNFMRGLTTI